MGCGTKLVTLVLFIFTIVFFLVGAALLGAGIWMMVSQEKLFYVLNLINEKTGSNQDVQGELLRFSGQKGIVSTAGAVLIAVGAVSAFISLFGCLGAVRHSKCLLGIYAGFIIAIFVAQIAAAVLAVLYKNDVVKAAKSELGSLQSKYLVSFNSFTAQNAKQPHAAISLLFNYMFVWAECCGINSTSDAKNSKSWLDSNRTWNYPPGTFMTVPAACCPMKSESKNKLLSEAQWQSMPNYVSDRTCPATGNGIHDKACVDAVVDFISRYSTWVLAGCGIFGAAQLVVIIFTLCLICSINKD